VLKTLISIESNGRIVAYDDGDLELEQAEQLMMQTREDEDDYEEDDDDGLNEIGNGDRSWGVHLDESVLILRWSCMILTNVPRQSLVRASRLLREK